MSIIPFNINPGKILRICLSIMFFIGISNDVNAQCANPPACSGTAITDASGNVSIPAGTTYYIAAGVTYTKNVTFSTATSVLCIQGTWTGSVNGTPTAGSTINVQYGGIINNATAYNWVGGGIALNIYEGGTVTFKSISTTGTNVTITNCGDLTFTGATGIDPVGGTFIIDNYASININGSINCVSGLTFTNYAGSQMYVGVDLNVVGGSFTNAGQLCVTTKTSFTGGTLTNNGCLRTTSYDIVGSGAFTNNNYMTIVGNFTSTGTANSNNGTLVITGNFTATGDFTFGSGSLMTCVAWNITGNMIGPASGCAQVRATGATTLVGSITAATSANLYFYDSGLPASGFDALTGFINSAHVNSNACTPTSYPACAMAGSACTSVLPITLTEFKAECKNQRMSIFWTTATETNNDHFTIERSTDAANFDPIGTVNSKAIGGNSTQMLSYSFTDNSFPYEENMNNLFYYRLKQTDFDGRYTYSFISPATSCSDNNCIGNIKVANDDNSVSLTIQSTCSTFIDLSIYNAVGQVLATKREYVETGSNTVRLDVHNMSMGLYILKANTLNQSFQKKFGKQ